MKKQSENASIFGKLRTLPVLLIVALLVFGAVMVEGPLAQADSIQQQIDRLNAENARNDAAVNKLEDQATSYQDAINRLRSQIGLLQAKIDNNTGKQARLQAQIVAAQKKLDQQKAILAEDLKAIYVNGEMSTVEMLATSKNLSDFVDAETYRNAVQAKIQRTLAEITQLQNELKEQKVRVEALLEEQRQQQNQLANDKAEQDNLLALNENQQATYNAHTKANQAKIDDLIAEQARLNDPGITASYYFLRFSGAVRSHTWSVNDYPYRNGGFGMSTAPGCVDNDGPDRWGYCTRQCVSYAAWAVQRSGRAAPMYYGNARDWVAAARADGVAVYTSNPRPGDVAISTAGAWGHAMYVEKVSGNQIFVSQYNQQLTGQYSTQWRTWQ